MARLLVCVVLSLLIATEAVRPSPGCGSSIKYSKGNVRSHNYKFSDPRLGEVARTFALKIPNSATTTNPYPLFLFVHGQYGSAMGEARSYQYDSVADDEGFVMLYPQGLAEDGGCGTGWNTGMQGDKSTCTSAATRGSCCYASCRSLGVCTSQDSKCAWASCYDDALFIEQLIDHIGDSACIDLDAIVISGESNGGMLMWDLVKKIPAKFAAVLPIYGAPLVGYGTIPPNKGAADLPMLYLTGRSDRLIPPKGGNGGGWLYLSAAASVANVAATHGCSSSTRSATTPYSGGRHNLACVEHTGCSGGRVMLCEYDGGHSFSSTLNAEKLAWWFASQFITRADATMIANNSTA